MKRTEQIIREIYLEFERNGAVLQRMNKKDLEIIFDICNSKNYIIWINDYAAMKPTFINAYASKFYGFNNNDLQKHGYKLYENFMHPDYFNDFHKALTFITSFPKKIYEATFKVKENNGDWRWTYSTSKALNYDKNGKTILLFSVVFDVSDLVEHCYANQLKGNNDMDFAIKNRPLYNSLTPREVEILHLIANEKTSTQIGKELNIQPSTVDSHRKKIIKKLNCKSSIGLAKYAFYFNR